MSDATSQTVYFYDRHPISCEIILTKLRASRGHLDGLTEEWGPILKERLAMYQLLREEARQAGAPMGHDAFHKSYIRFVDLIQEREMGGVRIVAAK
jgi:hypothetical protein